MTKPVAETTEFTRDVLGRYVCNGFDEALASAQARPFDTVIIGAGAFGAVVAQHLLYRDQARAHRILVLEAGPFLLPEHVQNLPVLDLNVPDPVSFDPGPRNEVWGLPWASDVPGGFVGLAYCVGGRSLYWGGWSPQPLPAELPSPPWPAATVADLRNTYMRAATDQLGVSTSNEFVYGPLQNVLRQQLFAQVATIADALPLNDIPDYPAVPPSPDRQALLGLLGLPSSTSVPPTDADLRNMLKLEAPLAVQSRAPLPGFFALNKFSGVPLLIEATRAAWMESAGNDSNKRVMLVPQCHVRTLQSEQVGSLCHVTAVDTNLGNIPIPPGGRVVLAMATIENTRMALASFRGLGLPNYDLIGKNLQVHLRSNLIIRVPRSSLTLDPGVSDLQGAALFLKGRRSISGGLRHFHLQISASGLRRLDTDAEAKLYKLVPDIDTIDAFRAMTDDDIVIAIRGVAEMGLSNVQSEIRLTSNQDEFGVPRAFVAIKPTADDAAMWDASDAAAARVGAIFSGTGNLDVLVNNRDGLGTTYHEAGTLAMGESPTNSVSNSDGRFHFVDNLFVTGPALFPTTGSSNPMLAGVALARRLAEHLA